MQALASEDQRVRVARVPEPVVAAWRGLREWVRDPATDFFNTTSSGVSVSREEYLEHGSNICVERFGPQRVYW